MKPVVILILFFLVAFSSFAQKYQVSESEMQIKGIPRKGQRILIQLDSKVVEKSWENYLRDKAGKITPNFNLTKLPGGNGISVLEKAKIDTISKTTIRVISKVEPTEDGTSVWWTLDLGNAYVNKETTPTQYAAAEGFLQNFARKVYREDVMRQVADAEKVLKNAQSEEARVIKKADDLKRNLDKNAARKLELEAELARNAKEFEQVNADIANNLKQQEAAKQEVENMRKSVEVVKAKAGSVE